MVNVTVDQCSMYGGRVHPSKTHRSAVQFKILKRPPKSWSQAIYGCRNRNDRLSEIAPRRRIAPKACAVGPAKACRGPHRRNFYPPPPYTHHPPGARGEREPWGYRQKRPAEVPRPARAPAGPDRPIHRGDTRRNGDHLIPPRREPRPAGDVEDVADFRRREGERRARQLRGRPADHEIGVGNLRGGLLGPIRAGPAGDEAAAIGIVAIGADFPDGCSWKRHRVTLSGSPPPRTRRCVWRCPLLRRPR